MIHLICRCLSQGFSPPGLLKDDFPSNLNVDITIKSNEETSEKATMVQVFENVNLSNMVYRAEIFFSPFT